MAPEPATELPNRALGPCAQLSPGRPFLPSERQALIELALTSGGPAGGAAALALLRDAELVAAAGFTRLID